MERGWNPNCLARLSKSRLVGSDTSTQTIFESFEHRLLIASESATCVKVRVSRSRTSVWIIHCSKDQSYGAAPVKHCPTFSRCALAIPHSHQIAWTSFGSAR